MRLKGQKLHIPQAHEARALFCRVAAGPVPHQKNLDPTLILKQLRRLQHGLKPLGKSHIPRKENDELIAQIMLGRESIRFGLLWVGA